MFTGIIEEMGVVKSAMKTVSGHSLAILANTVLEGLAIGDSITVNGACLTVIHVDATLFQVEVSPETGRVTTLAALKAGEPVNLERAMRLTDRLGGHLVTGHVDGVGTIRSRVQQGDAIQVMLEAPREVLRYCIPKGSITVDGVSLTINEVDAKGFRVTIIPHTTKATTLGMKQVGTAVNLETDLIGRYVDRLLQEREGVSKPDIRIDKDYLVRRGLV